MIFSYWLVPPYSFLLIDTSFWTKYFTSNQPHVIGQLPTTIMTPIYILSISGYFVYFWTLDFDLGLLGISPCPDAHLDAAEIFRDNIFRARSICSLNVIYSLILDDTNTLALIPDELSHTDIPFCSNTTSCMPHVDVKHFIYAEYYKCFLALINRLLSPHSFGNLSVCTTLMTTSPKWFSRFIISNPSSADSNPWRTCVTIGTMRCFLMNSVVSSKSLWESGWTSGVRDQVERRFRL